MQPKKERVTLTLDTDLLDDLRDYAETDDRSLSQYVNRVLKHHRNSHEEEAEMSRE